MNENAVFAYHPDVLQTNSSFSVLKDAHALTNLTDLSFCLSLMLFVFRPSIAYVFESGPNTNYDKFGDNGKFGDNEGFGKDEQYEMEERFEVSMSVTAEGPWVGVKNHFFVVETQLLPLEWNHVCVMHSAYHRSIRVVQNGRLVLAINDSKLFDRNETFSPDVLRNLVLGQRSSLLKEGVVSFAGQMTNLNMWGRALREEEAVAITTCNEQVEPQVGQQLKPDLIDWNNQHWIHSQVNVVRVNENVVCMPSFALSMFPEKRVFASASHLCQVLNGHVALPADLDGNNKLHQVAIANFSVCNRRRLEFVWLGATDHEQEGVWRDHRGNVVSIVNEDNEDNNEDKTNKWRVPWEPHPQEPNGQTKENCAAMKRGRTWLDLQCSFRLCTVCNFSTPVPRLRMRGLCASSVFDTHFTLELDKFVGNRHSFRGFHGSTIVFEPKIKSWILTSKYDGHIYALFNRSSDYPLGRQAWHFVNDSSCHRRNVHELKLSTCRDDQFTCDDGSCVNMSGRCDQRRDCADYSDEFQCKLIALHEKHYVKDYAPTIEDDNDSNYSNYDPNYSNYDEIIRQLPVVHFVLEILALDEIRELDDTLHVQFKLTLAWIDPRIVFHNLKNDSALNALTSGEKRLIWIPRIVFNNTDDEDESIIDDKASLTVLRKGPYSLSSLEELDERYVFSGASNPLVYSRHHNIEFQCSFDMTFYPFDIQKCFLVFVADASAGRFRLEPNNDALIYGGQRELTQYSIGEFQLHHTSDKGFVVGVTLKRRFLYQLLTTYLPSACLIIIIHATQYFKISYFHTRIMVSLTGMLVMTTLFLNTSSSLPKTSYFKMIDIWMVFGLLLPFLEVVLHTVTEYRRREELNENNSMLLRIQGGRVHSIPMGSAGPNSPNEHVSLAIPTTVNNNSSSNEANNEPNFRSESLNKSASFVMGQESTPKLLRTRRLARSFRRTCRQAHSSELTTHLSRTVIPCLVVLFNLVYWTVAFLH